MNKTPLESPSELPNRSAIDGYGLSEHQHDVHAPGPAVAELACKARSHGCAALLARLSRRFRYGGLHLVSEKLSFVEAGLPSTAAAADAARPICLHAARHWG
jgi:hypothetical protein